MPSAGYLIGIDFGTSNTVGVLRYPDGRSESLLFDGSPVLPSAVCLDEDGRFLTGRDATHVARTRPDAYEPNPKRRIDDGTVLLGGRDVRVTELLGAVLSRVMAEAARATGRAPERVVLTHPVAWGPRRLDVLDQAARVAGISLPLMVPEPIAAAFSSLTLPRMNLAPGQSVVVYDFGGGTFDATVVRRNASGFDVAAYQGLDDVGGLDIDAAVVGYLGNALGHRSPEVWERLTAPSSGTDRRASRLLWEDARQAKETLSRTSTVHIHVPLLDDEVPLGREQLEELARPLLARTVTVTRDVLRTAAVPAGSVATVLLVGGSSRIPLAATLLHQQLGVAPTVVENPELVVAQGAIAVGEAFARGAYIPPGAPPTGPAAGGPPRAPGPGESPSGASPLPASSPLPGAGGYGPGGAGSVSGGGAYGPGGSVSVGGAYVGGGPGSVSGGGAHAAPGVPGAGGAPPGGGGAPPGGGGLPAGPGGPSLGVVGRARSRAWIIWAVVGVVSLTLLACCGSCVREIARNTTVTDPDATESAAAAPSAPPCDQHLAFLGPQTGPDRDLGVRVDYGVRLAVAQYNASHDGCDVALTTHDTGSDPAKAGRLAKQLADDTSVLGVVGPVTPADTASAGEPFDNGGLPFVSPVGDATALATWNLYHQVIGDEDSSNLVAPNYLTKILKAQKVYLVDDGSTHGTKLAGYLSDSLDDIAAGRDTIKPDVADPTVYSGLAARIQAAGATAVFYAGDPAVGGRLRKALTDNGGRDVKLFGSSDLDAPAFFDQAGDAAEGTALFGPFFPEADAPPTFRDAYRAAYGEQPGRYSAEGFDSAKIFLDGIEAGTADRATMATFVNNYDADGLTKHLRFNDLGDLASPVMWLYEAKSGHFVSAGKLSTS
ncbi:ABC transporter substrate-binding protein [Cryptosporangium phraense]|uniref:ABC transporter substrate-binding protein n=1 Tax=Cryptosporangium phraense TaxID=2593070 RepID=A0A545AJ01_9ACTN|nr:ABC transporter substrate-binding protein [Cryptosporangium phraense]TQS40665.1 ABC transporter substrate-binding protein [Cryptosporangium phraense]